MTTALVALSFLSIFVYVKDLVLTLAHKTVDNFHCSWLIGALGILLLLLLV